jgi:Domain of unknown function (DUF222)
MCRCWPGCATAVTTSVALQLARWTRVIPGQDRAQAGRVLVAAARAGADLRALAAICAEIRSGTGGPDPGGPDDPRLDRGVSVEATFEGAGVIRGDLTRQRAAMVTAVLDALAAPAGRGDVRAGPQRYHDALAEAMRRRMVLRAGAAAGRAAGQGPGPRARLGAARDERRVGAAGPVDRGSTGPGGPPAGPPRRCAGGTAARGWTATRPGRSRATR